MTDTARMVTGAAVAAIVCLFTIPAHADDTRSAGFDFSMEVGHGVRHNEDGNGVFIRGTYLGESGAGCGAVLGAWDGDFENDVAGLTCEKRFFSSESGRPLVSIGVGAVAIEASPIVNSNWALEAHLRIFVTRHVALAYTHYSNAGYEHPNRGYNFASIEVLF